MKILVCICKVPDTTSKIRFIDNDTKFDTQNIQFIINPLDEFALTRALELKEADGGEIIVVSVGGADMEPLIRKALAIGADEAVRIDAEPTDSLFVAEQIATYAAEGAFDLIMTGRETIDYNGSQVGGMIAEKLGLPLVSGVSRLEINGSEASMDREIEGGKEEITVSLPVVMSAQEGITEPRIPTMRGIMAARTKPLTVQPPTGDIKYVQINNYESPPSKGDVKIIDGDNLQELVELLDKEAKVL